MTRVPIQNSLPFRLKTATRSNPKSAIASNRKAITYLDIWSHQWRRQKAHGDMMIIRYADDTVLGFEYEQEAKRFLQDRQERLQAFGLTLHPDKTQLIRFGRRAISDRKRLGEGKPATFDFLGFTHFCTQSKKNRAFVIGRQTIKKRLRATLHAIKSELRKRWHDPLPKTGEWIQKVLQGHLNYFAVSGNDPSIWLFFNEVRRLWMQRIKRRSQKGFMNWDRFVRITSRFFPKIRLLHPHPCYHFDVRTQGRRPVR